MAFVRSSFINRSSLLSRLRMENYVGGGGGAEETRGLAAPHAAQPSLPVRSVSFCRGCVENIGEKITDVGEHVHAVERTFHTKLEELRLEVSSQHWSVFVLCWTVTGLVLALLLAATLGGGIAALATVAVSFVAAFTSKLKSQLDRVEGGLKAHVKLSAERHDQLVALLGNAAAGRQQRNVVARLCKVVAAAPSATMQMSPTARVVFQVGLAPPADVPPNVYIDETVLSCAHKRWYLNGILIVYGGSF